MNEYGRVPVQVSSAPAPIGPYSQAIKCEGELVFASGQIALDPKTGNLVGADAAGQTQQIMKNLEAILTAAGSAWARVVKTTIFLTDMADFPVVNEIYGQSFPFDPPARSTIQVAGLPKGAKVEIELVATCQKSFSQFGGSKF